MKSDNTRPHWGRWLLLGLLLYAIFLVVSFPAAILAPRLEAMSAGALHLTGMSGTAWNGGGLLTAGARSAPPLILHLSWRFDPLWLLAGKAQWRLSANDNDMKLAATLRAGYHSTALRDTDAELPANLAEIIYPPAALFAPSGRIHVTAESLDLDANGLDGKLEILWSNAGVRLAPVTLGDYRAEVTGRGPVADVNLLTVRGPLELNGKGQWNVIGDGMLSLRGSAKLSPDAPPSLEPLVNMINANGMAVGIRLPASLMLGLSQS